MMINIFKTIFYGAFALKMTWKQPCSSNPKLLVEFCTQYIICYSMHYCQMGIRVWSWYLLKQHNFTLLARKHFRGVESCWIITPLLLENARFNQRSQDIMEQNLCIFWGENHGIGLSQVLTHDILRLAHHDKWTCRLQSYKTPCNILSPFF